MNVDGRMSHAEIHPDLLIVDDHDAGRPRQIARSVH
jgi:hypothetical protein